MLNFNLPLIFILLPLPLLVYYLMPPAPQRQPAIRAPFYRQWQQLVANPSAVRKPANQHLLWLTVIWLLLILAAAQPIWLGDEVLLSTEGRDVLVAVDLSGSMRQQDMQINRQTVDRLSAVKNVLGRFIKERRGDRLGLILFGSQAYVQAPLTFDSATVQQFLDEAQIGFAGEQTAIGDAIGLAIKQLRERPGERHVIVLLTDGSNNAGVVDPMTAARVAADNNSVIYTIGIGADEMLIANPFGVQRINPSSDLNEVVLQAMADTTGGQYFRARNLEELTSIYQQLDQLEPVADDSRYFRPSKALFYWPLGLVFLLSLFFALNSGLRRYTHHK